MSACLLCQYHIPLLNAHLGWPDDPVGVCRSCSSLSCGWHGALTSPEFTCIVCDAGEVLASSGWDALEQKDGALDDLIRTLNAGHRPDRGGPVAGVSDEDAAIDLARALVSSYARADRDPSAWVVATIEQWFAERPHYQQLMDAVTDSLSPAMHEIDAYVRSSSTRMEPRAADASLGGARRGVRRYGAGPIRALWMRLDLQGRRLLATAVLLLTVLDVPADMTPPAVADVTTLLGDRLRERIPDEIGRVRDKITSRRQTTQE